MALANANYEIIMADIGTNGRISDGGVLGNTEFRQRLVQGTLNIPDNESPAMSNHQLPYVFVGDEAFALRPDFMKPYAQKDLNHEKRIFNYRLSRARRIIENVFGIMASRFRIFHTTISLKIETIEKVVLACVALHNFLRYKCQATYSPEECFDREDTSNDTIELGLRSDPNSLASLQNGQSRQCSQMAKNVRVQLTEYFINEGAVPWQAQ